MAKIGDADFVGVSGKKYAFGVYSTDTTFKDIGAVYIFSKRTERQGKGSHSMALCGIYQGLNGACAVEETVVTVSVQVHEVHRAEKPLRAGMFPQKPFSHGRPSSHRRIRPRHG